MPHINLHTILFDEHKFVVPMTLCNAEVKVIDRDSPAIGTLNSLQIVLQSDCSIGSSGAPSPSPSSGTISCTAATLSASLGGLGGSGLSRPIEPLVTALAPDIRHDRSTLGRVCLQPAAWQIKDNCLTTVPKHI